MFNLLPGKLSAPDTLDAHAPNGTPSVTGRSPDKSDGDDS